MIGGRDRTEQEVREELKKQKEEFTKLDMKLAALQREYDKFRENVRDGIQSVFSSIP